MAIFSSACIYPTSVIIPSIIGRWPIIEPPISCLLPMPCHSSQLFSLSTAHNRARPRVFTVGPSRPPGTSPQAPEGRRLHSADSVRPGPCCGPGRGRGRRPAAAPAPGAAARGGPAPAAWPGTRLILQLEGPGSARASQACQ